MSSAVAEEEDDFRPSMVNRPYVICVHPPEGGKPGVPTLLRWRDGKCECPKCGRRYVYDRRAPPQDAC